MTDPGSPRRPFFEEADGAYAPNSIAGSPWGAGRQNGVAVGGLLAHTLLRAHPPEGMNIARFTLDILRPPPMAATQASWRPLRQGRRTTVLEGRLTVEGVEFARAGALFVRRAEEGAPATVFTPPAPLPEDAPPELMMSLKTGLESRILQRGAAGSGQPLGRVWVRPITSLVGDAPAHPVAAAVMAADFGGGVSSGVNRAAWTSPNIDIAVHFARPPRDQWILVEATTLLPGNGSALAATRLSDRFGLFGQAHQILALTPIEGAGPREGPP